MNPGLQWDRGSRAAEASTVSLIRPGASSFNGTAAREPRKLALDEQDEIDIYLQWDRGSRAAEAPQPSTAWCAVTSFNGTAAREPRKLVFVEGSDHAD